MTLDEVRALPASARELLAITDAVGPGRTRASLQLVDRDTRQALLALGLVTEGRRGMLSWTWRVRKAATAVVVLDELARSGREGAPTVSPQPFTSAELDERLEDLKLREGLAAAALRQRPGDQPLPVQNEHEDIQSLVIADIEARRELGVQRYGTALQPHNGRDMLRDAYEEAMDLTIYLKGCLVERDGTA